MAADQSSSVQYKVLTFRKAVFYTLVIYLFHMYFSLRFWRLRRLDYSRVLLRVFPGSKNIANLRRPLEEFLQERLARACMKLTRQLTRYLAKMSCQNVLPKFVPRFLKDLMRSYKIEKLFSPGLPSINNHLLALLMLIR